MDRAAAWAKWRCHESPMWFALDVISAVCVYRMYAGHVVTLPFVLHVIPKDGVLQTQNKSSLR